MVVVPHGPGSSEVTWGVSIGGPRLGTQVSTMTPQLRDFFGAPEDTGLLIQGVEPGSAAEAAGMKVGDVLVEVDGQRIDGVGDVHRALADRGDGDVVAVELVRKKKRKTLKVTLSDGSLTTVVRHSDSRSIPPEVRAEVEQQLERAREQLREVERQLDRGAGDDGPKDEKTRRLRRKKNKNKSKRRR